MYKKFILLLLINIGQGLKTEMYPDFVMEGSAFLDSTQTSFSTLFYEVTSLFSFEVWQGFLTGLYDYGSDEYLNPEERR